MIYAFPYILYFFSLAFLFLMPIQVGFKNRYFITHFYTILTILLFIGFRGFIVTDWVVYYKFYSFVPDLFSVNESFWNYLNWERGFLLYTLLIKTLTRNYFIFQFISFLIDLLFIDYFIKNNVSEKNYVLAYICFFVFQGFIIEVNLLRSSKAICLF